MIDFFYYQKYINPYFREPKKKAYTMLGLTLLSLSIFGAFAIRPALSVITSLERQLKEARLADKKLEEKIATLSSLQQQHQKVKQDLYLLDLALPGNPEVPKLLETLTLFSGKSSVTIKSIHFSPPRVYQDPKLARMTLDMVVDGSFLETMAFLKYLENHLRQISVEEISFSVSKGGTEDTLQVKLRLHTFFFLDQPPKIGGET